MKKLLMVLALGFLFVSEITFADHYICPPLENIKIENFISQSNTVGVLKVLNILAESEPDTSKHRLVMSSELSDYGSITYKVEVEYPYKGLSVGETFSLTVDNYASRKILNEGDLIPIVSSQLINDGQMWIPTTRCGPNELNRYTVSDIYGISVWYKFRYPLFAGLFLGILGIVFFARRKKLGIAQK